MRRFLGDPAARAKLAKTVTLSSVDVAAYDAVVDGGHGTMWDLPSPEIGAQLSRGWTAGKVLAAVCHGPAALVGVKGADGKPAVAGRRVAAFGDAEEKAMQLESTMPFLLESKLTSLGARYEKAPKLWQPFTVTDSDLVTGQNPASSKATAEATLRALGH